MRRCLPTLFVAGTLFLTACPDTPSDPPKSDVPDSVSFQDLVTNDVSLPDIPKDEGPDESPEISVDAADGEIPTTLPCSVDFDCEAGDVPECFESFCDNSVGQCKIRPRSDQPTCDDGDACTVDDKCVAGSCAGAAMECSDDNACTADSCEAGQGCVFTPVEGGCNDGDLCTTADRCQAGECVGDANPVCQCTVDADCEQFDDGNACNGTLVCTVKQCLTDETTVVNCAPSADPCKINACDSASGGCLETPAENGTTCDDGDACTTGDACQAGACTGQATICDDGNACTDDSCNSATGCAYTNNADACDDGDLCTSGDSCAGGNCVGTPEPACNCATNADCVAFEDGNLCNGTLICDAGVCKPDAATIVVCAPSTNQCSQTQCVPTSGLCVPQAMLDGTACNDGNACTQNDSCMGGVCLGPPVACDDANPCTDDACDPLNGCESTNNTNVCDDGDPCTMNDTCATGACSGAADPACTCNTDADCVDDGDLCNGVPSCVSNQCTINPATIVSCTTTNPCEVASCEPVTGACTISAVTNGNACNDDNACTENDVCVDGICGGGAADCDDANACTNDTCNSATGCTHSFNSNACDDGSECTTGDICDQGVCGGTVSPECVCTTTADCGEFEDADACNGTLICVGSKCVVDPGTVVTCDTAGNSECRTNTCDAGDGSCAFVDAQDGKPCSDGSECTEADSCSGGTCMGVAVAPCDDSNPCTDDSCDPAVGCVFVDNTATCDDNDPCTENDLCASGACQPGANTCPGNCSPAWTLECGGQDTWNNGSFGSTNDITSYSCNSFSYPGPEYSYSFTAPFDGEFTVQLSDEEAITDLMVLKGDGDGCDPLECVESSFASVTQNMLAGETWFFVVDGWNSPDAAGAYTINLNCVPQVEMDCTDGADDDQDGDTDCDDSDCSADVACLPPSCAPAIPIGCGASDTSTTNAAGSTDAVDGYSCNSFNYVGSEYTYSFTTPIATDVTVNLTNQTVDTDLMILEDTGTACDSQTCIGYTLSSGTTFAATPGTTYYFVVDGYNGANGTFTLNVACSDGSAETNCSDGVDNDSDDDTDCDDSDCFGVGGCAECVVDGDCDSGQLCMAGACADDCSASTCPAGTVCNGDVCSDTCSFSFECPQQQFCYNGLCAGQCTTDSDCIGEQFCGPGGTCIAGCVGDSDCPTGQACFGLTCTPECTGQSDCESGHSCVGGLCTETCTETADCLDGHTCAGDLCTTTCSSAGDCPTGWACNTTCEPPTVPEICGDTIDNDGDGLTDCLDGDCLGSGDCASCGTPASDFFFSLDCNDTDSWSTVDEENLLESYECLPWSTTGKEYIYSFTPVASGEVTVALSGLAADVDLDLIVLEELDGYCNPESCTAYGDTTATFTAVAGTSYFIIVDGFLGDEGDYTITTTCP